MRKPKDLERLMRTYATVKFPSNLIHEAHTDVIFCQNAVVARNMFLLGSFNTILRTILQ